MVTTSNKFKKGDTIKFTDGRIALVLNSGMRDREFKELYDSQLIWIETLKGSSLRLVLPAIIRRRLVWYPILLGDENLWINHEVLYYRMYGKLPPR